MKPRLYIMAKAPQLGKAKTRLAADIGKVHALRLYRRVPQWRGTPQLPQVSGSLSPRLSALFARKGPTIVIGTDCPQVSARDIVAALKALRRHKAVFGPADDGGFWLMGMYGPVNPDVFEAVRWSHDETLADITANIDGPVARLRRLTDVDDLDALNHIRAQAQSFAR